MEKLFTMVIRCQVVRFRDVIGSLEVSDVRCWSTRAAARAGSGLPGPRSAEGVRSIWRPRVPGCDRVYRQHGIPAGPVLDRVGSRGGAGRGSPIPARAIDVVGGPVGAGHDGRGDR